MDTLASVRQTQILYRFCCVVSITYFGISCRLNIFYIKKLKLDTVPLLIKCHAANWKGQNKIFVPIWSIVWALVCLLCCLLRLCWITINHDAEISSSTFFFAATCIHSLCIDAFCHIFLWFWLFFLLLLCSFSKACREGKKNKKPKDPLWSSIVKAFPMVFGHDLTIFSQKNKKQNIVF